MDPTTTRITWTREDSGELRKLINRIEKLAGQELTPGRNPELDRLVDRYTRKMRRLKAAFGASAEPFEARGHLNRVLAQRAGRSEHAQP